MTSIIAGAKPREGRSGDGTGWLRSFVLRLLVVVFAHLSSVDAEPRAERVGKDACKRDSMSMNGKNQSLGSGTNRQKREGRRNGRR